MRRAPEALPSHGKKPPLGLSPSVPHALPPCPRSPPLAGSDLSKLWFVLVTPVFEAPTREMRAALPKEITMKLHVENCAAGAGIVAGVLTGDAAMLGSALGSDTIVEVARGPLIPGFAAVKAAAVRSAAFHQKPTPGPSPSVTCVVGVSQQSLRRPFANPSGRSADEGGRFRVHHQRRWPDHRRHLRRRGEGEEDRKGDDGGLQGEREARGERAWGRRAHRAERSFACCARGEGLTMLRLSSPRRTPQVNYAGVAQLCASGARECTPGDAGGAAHGSIRVM